MNADFKNKTRLIILIVYTLAFGIGTTTHTIDAVNYGWPVDIPAVPNWLNMYWSSLIVLDPLAILLLWTRQKIGLMVALFIMLTDVAFNSYATYELKVWDWSYFLQLQSLFLGFLLGTAPFVWSIKDRNFHELSQSLK